VLVPAAREIMGSRLTRVDHYGTYACRTIYGRPGERPSAHARAAALDVAGFRFADGRRATVAADFRADSDEGRFVQAARNGACRVFGTVLARTTTPPTATTCIWSAAATGCAVKG
jgi:hypothetical protein